MSFKHGQRTRVGRRPSQGAPELAQLGEQEAAVLEWGRWAREQVTKWRNTTEPGRWDSHKALGALLADIDDVLGTQHGGATSAG